MRFFVCLFVIIAVFVVADVDGRGTVQIEDAAQFQLTSSADRHCLSAESGSMCVGPGETDYQWFFTEQEVIMSTRYLATQVTVQESLDMTAVSTSLSGNTNMNLGEAEWTGNVVDLKDGESFYFMNYLSSGQVPNVYIGNGSIQVPLLTDALLPLDPTLGGTGSQNLDGVMATFQLGSLSMLDGADTALDVLTIVNGGTGLTDIIADPFQHGSLAFEDGVDRFQPLELPRTQGGTGAGEIESAAFQLGLGAYAFEEYILPDFENMPRLPIRKGGFTLPENLGSLSHLDLAIGYDLSLSFDLSSGGTGASSIQSVSTNLQLGSIAERDSPSSYDFFTTIPVDQGGTNTRSNQNTALNLQLGVIGQHDSISQTDLKDSLNIQNGGTQAKSISPALNNFQLGRLADEDLISLALDYREVRTLELGGLASSNLEQASKNMQLGGLATDEQFELRNYVDQLPPSRGGLTSAGLQLGSLSEADDIDVRLLNRFVLSIADSGLATTQVSTVWSNLQVGSIGFTDIADLEVDFFGSIDISQGGLGTSSLEGFLPSTQSGAVATEEIAFSIVDVLPVHKGGTSSSNVETAALWGLQLGSLATWDDVDTDQLIGSLTRNLGATGVNSVVDLNPLLQLGSLSVEDIGDDYISSLSFSLSQGGLPSQSLSTDFGRFAFEDDAPIEKELRDVVPVSQEGTGVSSIGKVASRYQFGSLAREEDLSSSTLMGSSLFNLNEGGLGGSNIERDVTNLQLGSLAYGDFFVPLDLYESFQISQGGTGDNSLTRVSETFMSGSLSLEDLVTPTLIPAGVIKWTIAQGGTSTEDLERARVNFQYGSIAIEDTSGQFNLGDFVITVSQGGVASTVNGLGPNFQGGSLIWEDIFSPTYWTNSELLPRKNGGLVPVTAPFLGALSTEDWVSGYEQDRAAILDVPLSGTSAIEIESVRNNFQLGYFSTEDFSYLSYLSIKDSNVKNGFLPRAGIEGFSTSYQLGNLAKEDEEDNYLLYGSITRRQGGVGNADSLQVGSVGLADWIDINLFGASIGTSSGGTGFNTIEGALGAVQLGSTAFEDWGYLPHANNVFTRQTGGTSSKNLEGATSTLQLGSVSFDDIGQLERSTMLISPRQGGLYYPSTVEGNWVGDQLGSMSSNDYVDERDLRLVSAFTFLQGGTAADDIELARDNLQLGSIASEDITKYSVLFDPLVISNGGTGEQSINDVPNDFFLGSIAPDDFIDPYLFTTTAGLSAKSGMSYVRHGMISPAMSQGLEGQLGLGRLGVEDWVSLKYDLDLTLKMRQGGLAVSSLSQFGPATQTGSLSQLDIVDSEDLFRGSVFGIGSGGTGAGTLETAGTNFLLGSISREEQWSNTLYSRYSPLLQRNEGGLNAKNIETARNNLLLGSVATQDSVDVTDLPTRTIKQGGTQATTLENADNNLQLGSLAFAESVSTSLLSASFKLPSANGGFNLVLNSPQWQLGSLSTADVVESSIFDYYPTLSIKGGGLEAQNMDVARNNLEIGSLGLDDIIFARDFYSLDEFYPISLGGTQTSQVAGLTNSLQLGSLAQEDMISATEVDDTPPDITVGQTGVTGIEELLATWYLGSSATADSELPDRLIVRNGGSSATHLEAADLNLQLGSAASEDHITFSDMGRFVVPIAYGGLAGSNIEISKNQLQLGSSAAEDFFYGTVFFDVTEGGTKATTIDAAKNNFQLGLLSSQDTVASYDFRATFPVKRGGLSGAPSPDLALQAGSLAFEELVEPVYDIRGVLYSLSEGGTGTGYMEAGSVPFFNSGVTKWIGDQDWGAFVPSSEATPANGGSLRLNTNTNDPTVAVEMTSPATHTTSLKLSQSRSDWSSPPAGSAVLSLSATYLGPEQSNWANGNVNYIDFRKKTGASSATMGGFVSTGDSTIVSVGFTSVGADYAEHLQQADSQEKIQPGDLVALFGNGTVSRRYDPSCAFCPEAPVNFLIASSAPTVVGGMPTDADTNSTSVIVAFLGRVPARVVGPVKKGDFLVPSGRMDGSMAAISPALFQKQGHRFSYFVGVAWDDYHPSTFSASPFSASSAASGLVNAGVGLPTQRIFSPILQARRQQQVDDLSLVLQQQEKTLASLSSKIDRLRQLIRQTETLIQ